MHYEHNPADILTKLDVNEALKILLKTHSLSHPVEQYVIPSLSSYYRFSRTSNGKKDDKKTREVT